MLKFNHKDGRVIPVKERTKAQIYSVLKRYIRADDLAQIEYIGNQHISVNNGNIYADFYDHRYTNTDGKVHRTTLYIAGYDDYINEII